MNPISILRFYTCCILLLTSFIVYGKEQRILFQENSGDTTNIEKKNQAKRGNGAAKKITVIILPCSNGYGQESNIESAISNALLKDTTIKVLPFPYKTLQHVAYYGVYDKRYCAPIIKKVRADYLVMSELTGIDIIDPNKSDHPGIGYGIRILNTKTLRQINSIKEDHLGANTDIDKSIMSQSTQLIRDILTCK